jgi:hypothetical protein
MSDYGSAPPPPPPPPPPYGPTPGQPGPPPPGGGAPPPNYLVWAILTTIFCCTPLGIVSIVYAAQVNSKWQMGDYAGAQESARKAKQFAMWAAIALGILVAIYIVFAILAAVMSNS